MVDSKKETVKKEAIQSSITKLFIIGYFITLWILAYLKSPSLESLAQGLAISITAVIGYVYGKISTQKDVDESKREVELK